MSEKPDKTIGEDSEAKKARMMRAIVPPPLPAMSRAFTSKPATAESTPKALDATAAAITIEPKAEAARDKPAEKPNFKAMRRSAEQHDPVAGKTLKDEQLVQMTHYLSVKERQDFKLLAVINNHSMNEVIRHAVRDYIALHQAKLPK